MGNIMLDETFEGILNGWDHAIKLYETGEGHPHCAGTWQFMSIALLQNTIKLDSILDDVESCFWVLYKTACHSFPFEDPNRPASNMNMFDEHHPQIILGGCVHFVGGDEKYTVLSQRTIQRIRIKSVPPTSALHSFADILSCYHDYRNYENAKDRT
ncbi:hypothetical protein BDY19DRAFT_999123 [Irpex rosettiformis]|uniref:Uncharacterized protein n=1 Tax=Irpex rosettiformis TaxID=378272 RepID=A0ACB8TLP8_9APHY|nr:hypothetical protein BDY19DRAFT_999123 [Irpex rosettiformis]